MDIVVYGWMVNNLELSGNSLLLYALLYGQTVEKSESNLTLREYAEALNISTRSVINLLQSLCSDGLLEKREIVKNKVKSCFYSTTKCPTSKKWYK